ncbi:hypothetical protein [Chryseobacterium rhizosphaerae]|uniref:hypothetical protein n=1 Tax=Chryseobacterium rhizosphaerae TaxID=395937 RepID=UPI002358A5B3|nr:hypothetical protein [Chryseobacterium rhizosphaerae]MDC8101042.1 hypothetical protein [Chryseobacterium rhizosphaerae]
MAQIFSQITPMLFAVYKNAGLDSFGMTNRMLSGLEYLIIGEVRRGEVFNRDGPGLFYFKNIWWLLSTNGTNVFTNNTNALCCL